MAKNAQYYVTEQEIAKLFNMSGLPQQFTVQFTKDYASVKRVIDDNGSEIGQIKQDISSLGARVSNNETSISQINSDIDSIQINISDLTQRVDVVEVDLSDLSLDFDGHVNSELAHGSTGNIVGTDDYCSALVGGTVLQATPLALSTTSIISVSGSPNAAPAAYSQVDAATWVSLLNELKTDFNSHITEFNLLVNKLNAIITTQVSAKQRSS